MLDIVPSAGVLTDCNQHVTPLASSSPIVLKKKKRVKHERPSPEPVFGLSVLGYCRNMTVQHGRLRVRGGAYL